MARMASSVMTDVHGTRITWGSRVAVVSYDGSTPRMIDCGRETLVTDVYRTKVEIIDADGEKRRCNPKCLRVIGGG